MGLRLPIIIKTLAPQKPEEINDFILALLSVIKNNISLDKVTEQNCKLVVVELITNAIKHVKGYENILEVCLDYPLIKISKIDNGPRFQLVEEALNKKKCTNNYWTEIVEDGTILFKDQDIRIKEDLDSFPENYGFEIITKASQFFSYKYNADKTENIFTAIIKS